MPRCPRCEQTFDAEDLTHHVVEGVHHVHCPDCGCAFGAYNERANRGGDRTSEQANDATR